MKVDRYKIEQYVDKLNELLQEDKSISIEFEELENKWELIFTKAQKINGTDFTTTINMEVEDINPVDVNDLAKNLSDLEPFTALTFFEEIAQRDKGSLTVDFVQEPEDDYTRRQTTRHNFETNVEATVEMVYGGALSEHDEWAVQAMMIDDGEGVIGSFATTIESPGNIPPELHVLDTPNQSDSHSRIANIIFICSQNSNPDHEDAIANLSFLHEDAHIGRRDGTVSIEFSNSEFHVPDVERTFEKACLETILRIYSREELDAIEIAREASGHPIKESDDTEEIDDMEEIDDTWEDDIGL